MINTKLRPQDTGFENLIDSEQVAQENAQRTKKFHSMKKKRAITNSLSYLVLAVLGIIWIIPIIMIIFVSLRNVSSFTGNLIPEEGLTFHWYYDILVSDIFPFKRWFFNTLIVAIFCMVISTLFVMSVAYTMSRLRFKARKGFMNINLILGMFPGFMSMIAVYNILKALGISGTLISLILIYSGASGSGFLIAKGFFDTVSKSLDESARIDGANNFKVFYKIVLPLSKPILVYTLLTSFMSPWVDYIFSSVILRDNTENYTIALGLYNMIQSREDVVNNMTMFFAGSVLISIPIMILFLFTQKYYVAGVTGGSVKG